MNFSTPWFKKLWLNSPGLKSSWLKSQGLEGPWLKLWVEIYQVEMSLNLIKWGWFPGQQYGKPQEPECMSISRDPITLSSYLQNESDDSKPKYIYWTVEQFVCFGLGSICYLSWLDSCLQTYVLKKKSKQKYSCYVHHKHNTKWNRDLQFWGLLTVRAVGKN